MFHVNESSGIPVYLQLREQILHAVSTGRLKPGDQLPTVREVAVDLEINPNTVNRAYAELEREGIVTSRRGKGTFIAGPSVSSTTLKHDRLADICRRALAECQAFGFSADELINVLKRAPSSRSAGRKAKELER